LQQVLSMHLLLWQQSRHKFFRSGTEYRRKLSKDLLLALQEAGQERQHLLLLFWPTLLMQDTK